MLGFFLTHLAAVNFIYGLSFVILGAAILVQPRPRSDYALTKILWIFALFAVLQGAHQLVTGEIIGLSRDARWEFARFFIALVSFLFFFGFSRELLRLVKPRLLVLSSLQFFLFIVFLSAFAFLSLQVPDKLYALTRYFIIFPSSVLLWYGLRNYYLVDRRVEPFKKYFIIFSDVILFYGIFSGVITERVDFWPAYYLNSRSFLVAFKVPVEIFRAVCALGMLAGIIKILNLFEWEYNQRMDKYVEELNAIIFNHRRMEGALRESEAAYRLAVENAPDGAYVSDQEGNFTFVNETLGEMFGYKKEEMRGMSVYGLSGANAPIVKNLFNDILETAGAGAVDVEVERRDKQRFIVEIKFRAIDTAEGSRRVVAMMRDVTGRKNSEDALQRERRYYQTLLHRAAAGVALFSVEEAAPYARVSLWNEKMSRISGYSEEEMNILGLAYLFSPEAANQEKIIARIQQAGKGLDFVNEEWPLMTKDKKARIVSIYSSVINVNNQANVLCFFHDVTERNVDSREARDAENKYQRLVENLNVGVYRNTPGPRGEFLEVNLAMARMFGYDSREELLKLHAADLHQNPADRKTFSDKILSAGFVQQEELLLKKKDNTPIWVAVTAVVVRDEQGNAKYFDGIIEDITEHKKTEQALVASEEKLRLIAENSSDIILAYDISRNIYFVNPAFEEITGYSPREIINSGYLACVHPQDAYKIMQIMGKLFNQRLAVPYEEFRLISKNGREKYCSSSWNVIYDKNNVYQGALAIIKDITEIKDLNQQLEHKERLAMLGEAIAAASHELKNPLQVISLGLDKIRPHLQPAAERYFTDLKAALKRAAQIISDMLEFSKIQKVELKSEDVGALINQTVAEVSADLSARNITVVTALAEDITKVNLDRYKIRQALLNLINNAAEAMEGGGKIEIETKALAKDDSRYLEISISDNGPGIDPALLNKIFSPFFTTKPGGTGLGLCVVQKIIALHSGRISVSSRMGEGARFVMEIPTS